MKSTIRGFTLLELLVALAVFAVLSITAYSGLRNVLFTRTAVEAQNQRLAMVQLAVYRLAQDIAQTIPRNIRDEYGDSQYALLSDALGDDRLSLTRNGWDNPLGQMRTTLQRVTYRLRDQRLWRLYWPVLDRGGRIDPRELMLIDHVSALKIRFWDTDTGDWIDNWPPEVHTDTDAENQDAGVLPRLVEIRLTLEDWGDIIRVLPLSTQ